MAAELIHAYFEGQHYPLDRASIADIGLVKRVERTFQLEIQTNDGAYRFMHTDRHKLEQLRDNIQSQMRER